jgi:hypothetical protein
MSYWYGARFVVVEGYQTLRLTDDAIDQLLDSPNTDLLRRYRNGSFHYQPTYFDSRFVDFLREGEATAEWVAQLHRELGRYCWTALGDSTPR